jgi:hypothetical protein
VIVPSWDAVPLDDASARRASRTRLFRSLLLIAARTAGAFSVSHARPMTSRMACSWSALIRISRLVMPPLIGCPSAVIAAAPHEVTSGLSCRWRR